MAKSKFPGKPQKTSQITRLRVSTNGNGSANDSSRFAAQQAAYGLKLFYQHFAADDEDDDDFIGFEKTVDGSFKPHFQLGNKKSKNFRVEREHEVELPSKTVNVSCVSVVTSQHQPPLVSKHSFDTWRERTSSVNQTSSASSCAQPRLKSSDDSQLEKKLHERTLKQAHPSKVLPTSKIIAPAKRILTTEDHVGKRDTSEDSEKCRKPRPVVTKQSQCPVGEEDADQEKNRIKREIERYTSIMTTEVADNKQAADEKKKAKKNRSPSRDGDKAEKLREKIQQLLRKQWESRLQLVVDPKPQPQAPLESKTESQEDRGSSMSVSSSSSSEEDRFYKRRRMNSNSSSSSSARKSKIILRKARLQLNQRLLKQLRQPSRLQQLVEPKPASPVELPKTVQPSPSSILRPAQLVLQTAPAPVPRVPPMIKEPTKPVKVLPPPAIKSSYIQKASEASTVTNPLGCAFVMEPSDTKGLPGTVVCGVCGAVRRYSFILQARKFGTFSCEPCRKFISRVLRARLAVKCTSGSGHCIHPPVLRWNNACPPEDRPASGEVMTARCKACWLKLALTGFQMRESDHDDLRKLLPAFMQDSIPLACDRPTNLHWAPNRGQMIRMKSNSSIPNVPASTSLPSSAAAATPKIKNKPAASKKAEHCPGSRTREKSGGGGSTTEIHSGPRVKHVCRSAVVARAQPRATFDDSASKQLDVPCDCCTLPDNSSLKASASDTAPTLANGSGSVQNSAKLSRSTDRKNSLSSPAMPLTTSQGERSRVTFRDDVKLGSNQRVGLMTSAVRAWQQQDLSRTKNSQFRCMTSGSAGRKPAKLVPKGVLLPDLWEHYDADRVWDQGFAMCCSQLSMTSPLCFLCGSSGRNELVCCSSCCESFHPFCVADSAPLSVSAPDCHHWDREAVACRIEDTSTEPRYAEKGEAAISVLTLNTGTPWICLNCVVCQICCSSSGERMVCSTCSHAYHWSCLGPAHPSSKRKRRSKWQCYSCSRIEDKFCPLCFKCHTASRQMKMECNCCGTWVHAECEELSEEDFRLLCSATKIDYVCSLCCPEKNWADTLRRHANQIFTEILAKLSEVENMPTSELDAICDKVNRNEYQNCAEFDTDIRQFSDRLSVTDSSILALVPWTETIQKKQPVPQQKISITAKVEYDADSDSRLCALCHGRGEGPATGEGRLLYCGNDIWTHINCALWSNEVFEEVDGALQNVFDALARGSGSRCSHCNAKGATVNCCIRGCPVSLHFPCALQPEPEVTLLEGKRLICRYHAKDQSNKSLVVHPPSFEVARCVYVDLGSESKRIKPYTPRDIRIVIGSLSVSSLGQLRTDVSSGPNTLTPVGFECQRRFWSVKEPWKVVMYTLRTIYVPGTTDGKDLETNVTVSHEEDDVIMAESGLNLAELDTQDDRELIHMVLEDANFEQELEGEPNASATINTSNELRDSGFYSDGRSAGEMSPSPTEDNALEAWLADPEHAVIFLDSALLASLDIESDPALPKTPTLSGNAADDVRASHNYPQSPELHSPPKRNLRSKRLSYTQWRKMRLQNRKDKRTAAAAATLKTVTPAVERPSTLDWNGNEAEWNSVSSSNLVASIKVSPLSPTSAMNTINTDASWRRKSSSGNILQLDGAADSSDTEPEKTVVVKLERMNEDEPVKCRRCRRSYRTLQSFNKHVESCVELLSSSSGSEDESEEEIVALQPKKEPVDPIPIPIEFHPKEEPMDVGEIIEPQPENGPIQVPIVNSSSQAQCAEPTEPFPKPASVHQQTPSKPPPAKPRTQRRRFRPNINAIPPRNIAIRQPPTTQGVRFTVPAASPVPASYQVTLQSPPPPPVLYVTRPELNSNNSTLQCGFLSQSPLAVPQQHYIIMPPSIDQTATFVPANCGVPTLSSSGLTLTQHASSPMVQYLGAVPSNLLSALGIMTTTNMGVTNYTVPSFSTLLQSQPLQVPWESPVSNQIVILPQQPLLSFNLPSVSLQPAPQPSIPNILLPSASAEKKKSAVGEASTLPKESTAPPPPAATVLTSPVDCEPQETVEKNLDAISTLENAKSAGEQEESGEREEVPALKSTPDEQLCEPVSDGKPPKPTYSYRSAMGGKRPRTIAPMGCEAKEDQQPSSIVQQLKVVAHPSAPDKATRTFHLKAVSDDQERIREEMDEMKVAASKMTEDTPETSDALADICDVFATPPASSEPPILPSDIDAEPISWPVIDSTLPSEEIKAPPQPPQQPTQEGNGGKKRKEAHIMYELVSDDGFYAQSESLSAVWQKLLDAVQDARLAFKMEPLYNGCLKSVDERSLHLTGLHHHALINLLEQLPNADQFSEYTFRYRTQRDLESAEKLITGSTYGCVRAAPFNSRVPYDMFGWLASQYRPRPQLSARAAADLETTQQPAGRRVTNFELLPMTVRFKHLRQVAKNSVGVFRSHIHGRGLFCTRDIECGEMVVEYAGQVIRSVLCDKREKEYEAKGMGCYMFRVDEQTVVDATVHGNAARFINHSCEPNCYSRIVDIFGKKHIIIFALRRIHRGEELTYDYKFPLEDVKIPCTCGSRKCRKYLN